MTALPILHTRIQHTAMLLLYQKNCHEEMKKISRCNKKEGLIMGKAFKKPKGRGGYIGWQRSVRSEHAVEKYEVPLSWIKKDIINQAITVAQQRYSLSDKQVSALKSVPVYVWKEQKPTSWHHTGKFFEKTYHYNLVEEAHLFATNPELISETINSHKRKLAKQKKQSKNNGRVTLYRFSKQIWNGDRRNRTITGYDDGIGITIGRSNRLYVVISTHNGKYKADTKPVYYTLHSHSLAILNKYHSFADLIKKHKKYARIQSNYNALLQYLRN